MMTLNRKREGREMPWIFFYSLNATFGACSSVDFRAPTVTRHESERFEDG